MRIRKVELEIDRYFDDVVLISRHYFNVGNIAKMLPSFCLQGLNVGARDSPSFKYHLKNHSLISSSVFLNIPHFSSPDSDRPPAAPARPTVIIRKSQHHGARGWRKRGT